MTDFIYRARAPDGTTLEGTLEAASAQEAAHTVAERGVVPLVIQTKRGLIYDVTVEKGSNPITPTWRLASDDGTRAVWKTTRWKYVFGILLLLVGGAVLALPWLIAEGVFDRILLLIVGAIPCLAGLFMLATKDSMTVDQFTRKLEMKKSGARPRCFRREDIARVIARWRLVPKSTGKRKFGRHIRKSRRIWQIVPEAEVCVVTKEDKTVNIERCRTAERARPIAEKIAEYLRVPLENTLDSPIVGHGKDH